MRIGHSHSWLLVVALAVALALAAPAPLQADFEAGAAAYQQGNYAKAIDEWVPLAEAGNQQAQYNIGYMHFNGIGVPKEPAKAARWFTMAAEQGDAAAQMSLGVMYGTGQGVAQDYSKAYIWLTLAAARLPYGDDRDQAIKNRDIVSAKMSRAQITEALGQALNWSPKPGIGGTVQAASASVPPTIPAASPPAPAPPKAEPSTNSGATPGEQIAAANGTQAAPSAPAQATATSAAEANAAEEAKAAAAAKAAAEAQAAEEAKAAAARTQTAALTTGTGFLVQLAALRSTSAAEAEWLRLKQRHSDVLGNLQPVLQPVDLAAKGTFVRLRVGPFASAEEAATVCRQLRAQKQDCVVVAAGRV